MFCKNVHRSKIEKAFNKGFSPQHLCRILFYTIKTRNKFMTLTDLNS